MSYVHSVNASEIIDDALLLCGAKDEDEAASGAAITHALRQLNNMIKSWQIHGIHLWRRQEAVVFVTPTSGEYSLGPASSDAEWCEESDYSYTLLNGDHTATTTISVDSTSGMSAGGRVGIELADGTRQWTTVLQVTSTTALKTQASITASDNATVFSYTSRPQRPLEVVHARRAPYNGSDVPIEVEALNEYFDTPNKTSTGTVNFVAYKPTRTSGTLYIWQRPSTVRNLVKLTIHAPLADVETVSDTTDFPSEWFHALSFNLAVILEPTYRQLDPGRRVELKMDAKQMLDDAIDFDADPGSLRIQPR